MLILKLQIFKVGLKPEKSIRVYFQIRLRKKSTKHCFHLALLVCKIQAPPTFVALNSCNFVSLTCGLRNMRQRQCCLILSSLYLTPTCTHIDTQTHTSIPPFWSCTSRDSTDQESHMAGNKPRAGIMSTLCRCSGILPPHLKGLI